MIRLRFIGEDNFSSNLIAGFSSGHLSHVDAVLADGTLLGARSDRLGGKPSGVQIRPADYIAFAREVIFTVPATADQETKFWSFLMQQGGKPYDRLAIFAFMINRNWRDLDGWICSELIMAALEYSGVCPALYLASNKITPVAAALVVSALGASSS